MTLPLLIIFGLLLVAQVPIAMALIGSAVGAVAFFSRIPVEAVFHRMTGGLDSFVLLAIPFFILAGNLMNTGGITERIFKFANLLVGRIPGGLGHANVVASIIFSGMSGSAVADTGGLGAIEMEAMKNEGFSPEFSGAVTAASATIGPIIPPSVPMVVYGVMAEVSIGALFMAGFVPGLLMGLCTMVLIFFMALRRDYPRLDKFHFKKMLRAFGDALFALLTPVIIIGGILLGIFTPTEAAVVAVLYALFLGFVVYKELTLRKLYRIMVDSMVTTATVTMIIAAAASFSWILARQGVPTQVARWLTSMDVPLWIFLLLFNVFFLFIGTFMEALSVLVIAVPVLVPAMKVMGLDPLHMGVVLVLNLMIGLITPPVGMSLFVTSKIGNIPLENLYKEVMIFIVPLIVVLLISTYMPDLILWLPRLVGFGS
ncbi:TRAP transporter large permease [Marispirochaeta sp.]|jgi:tripartite ATP-independent transporter DctM subunit|uniref:TRAP transporter large permease n=1 Tax=Marispirochaeta sp. TaxID=2038653 RepID=UPI0029C962FC|nr:TRAP transporter large permease [Marispirochaeta sp.]